MSPRNFAVASPVLILMALAGSGCQSNSAMSDPTPPEPSSISGRYIAVLSDADLGATAFSDGMLSRPRADGADALTIIRLPMAAEPAPGTPAWDTGFAQAPVSNSVMGPPTSLTVSRDGTFAVVAETRGQAGPTATRIGELPMGTSVIPIDLTDPMRPVVLAKVEVGKNPQSVDLNPTATVLAIATQRAGGQIVLAPVAGKTIDRLMAWPLMGMEDDAAAATGIAWSPDGKILAVTVAEKNLVAFYEFNIEAATGDFGLRPFGEPVTTGKYPFHGKFSPDGRFFITTDLQWGADVKNYLVGAPEGTLSVIKLSEQSGDATAAFHQVVDTQQVGISPESLAISADGKFVATANLRTSMLAAGDAQLVGGSITLLSFDTDTGLLTLISETPIDAMPEGLTFDASDQHLIVSKFRSLDPRAVDGELDFYKLVRGSEPRLVKGDFSVGVGIGPHGVVIVR